MAYAHYMSDEFEEMERIPWAALAASAPDPRRRLVLVAAGLVVIVSLVVIIASALFRSSPAPDSAAVAPSGSVPVNPDQPASVLPDPTPAAIEPVAPQPPPVYSEADLMAVLVEDEVRIAVMWAEHFVRDYLTVDGDGATAADAARVVAAELPAAPSGVTSFVEWVEAYAVTAIRPSHYRVEVGYRLLAGSDGSYVRQPAAAMAVEVSVDVDGIAGFAGLPELVSLPAVRTADAPGLTDDLPDWVMEKVKGEAASVVGGYREGEQWRVVVMSELAPGVVRSHLVTVEG
jgi:hypothetical protein